MLVIVLESFYCYACLIRYGAFSKWGKIVFEFLKIICTRNISWYDRDLQSIFSKKVMQSESGQNIAAHSTASDTFQI